MTQENPLARRLKHRNIVAATEMPDGESLRKVLDSGPLPIARAIRLAHDIASGLAHAHLEGVVHGSLKPSSIIVSPSGVARITDFGGAPVDHRNDIFALGTLLYEMLAHRPPGEGKPLPPSELNPLVPRALDAIVLSMLAPQPADRMPGVPILLRELQRLEEGLGLEPDALASTAEPAANAHDDFHARKEPSAGDAFQNRPLSDEEEFDYRRAMMERQSRQERSSGSWKAVVPALALVLVMLGIGFGGFMYYSSSTGKQDLVANRGQDAPAAAGPTAPAPVPEPLPAKAVVTERVAVAQDVPAVAPAGSGLTVPPSMVQPVKEPAPAPETATRPVAPEPAPSPQTKSPVVRVAKAPAPASQPAGTAQLVLAISPGGEVYIDGEHLGTAPQTTTFDLEPGMRRIEIRSGSRKPFLTFMTVEPGDVRRIRHDFDAKPSRPPT